jgi:hypothetical protein
MQQLLRFSCTRVAVHATVSASASNTQGFRSFWPTTLLARNTSNLQHGFAVPVRVTTVAHE